MKTNMGSMDRGIRVLVSVALFTFYYLEIVRGSIGIIFLAGGIVLLLTSLIGFCPLYAPFGFNTRRKKVVERH